MEKTLASIYVNPRHPAGFSSIKKLYDEARKHHPSITKDDVRAFLAKTPTYTLYKRAVRKFRRLKTVPTGWFSECQADLMVFINLASHNDGYKYLLVILDVHSRYVFLEPVYSKSTTHMMQAFKNVFKRMPTIPLRLTTDAGLEFVSAGMRAFFKRLKIDKRESMSNPHIHASIAERCNRTIRDRLKKYFLEYNTKRWIDIISDIAYAINHSVNTGIGIRPVDVNSSNSERLWQRLYGKTEQSKTKPVFKENDTVRMFHQHALFGKNQLNFSDELYRIDKVLKNHSPVVYKLTDLKGEPILGYFYAPELTAASIETTWRVEKVLRRRIRQRKPEYFVKWAGFDNSFNVWITKDDLV
jgi:transposase InsO family protein